MDLDRRLVEHVVAVARAGRRADSRTRALDALTGEAVRAAAPQA